MIFNITDEANKFMREESEKEGGKDIRFVIRQKA